MRFQALLVAALCLLSACVPVYTNPRINAATGSSSDQAPARPVASLSIGDFSGFYGGEFKEAIVRQLESRGFTVTYAAAQAANDRSQLILGGTFEGGSSSSTYSRTNPLTGITEVSTNTSRTPSKGTLRVVSKLDGQTVKSYSFDLSQRPGPEFFSLYAPTQNVDQLSALLIAQLALDFKPDKVAPTQRLQDQLNAPK